MIGTKKRRAVFLDRDGTIIEDVPYLFEPEKVAFIKGAAKAIEILNRLGFMVLVVTNQSGVRRGYFKDKDVSAVHARIDAILEYEGGRIDAYYYCPHEPMDGCNCRKPETGMIDKAASKHSLDVENSYVIGDKSSDLWLASNVGATSILVRTGLGLDTEREQSIKPGFIARDILQAVEWIIIDSKSYY